MSEDFKVQVQRPSATPYALGGAVLGGLAGYGATHFDPVKKMVTDPITHETLVNEVKDVAEFSKTLENASEADKSLVDRLKAKVNEAKAAEETWQKEFDAFKETKKPELAADHALMQEKAGYEAQKATAETKLKDKIAQLEKAEAERLQKEAAKQAKSPEDIQKTVENIGRKITEAKQQTQTAQKNINAQIDLWASRMVEVNGKEAGIIRKEAEEAIIKEINALKGVSPKQKEKLIKETLDSFSERIGTIERAIPELSALSKAETALKEELNGRLTGTLAGEKIPMERKIQFVENKVTNKNKELKSVNEKLAKLKEQLKKHTQAEHARRDQIRQRVKDAERVITTETKTVEEQLSKTGKKIGEKISTKTSQSNVSSAERFVYKPFAKKTELESLKKQALELQQEIKKENKILKTAKELAEKRKNLDNITSTKANVVLENDYVTGLQKTLRKISGKTTPTDFIDEAKEIVAKAPEKFKAESDAVKTVADKIDDVAKRIATERNNLASAIDEKTLIEEFAKDKGQKADAAKKVWDGAKDDLANFFKDKAGNINWKKAGTAIAATAAIGTAIGLLLRPKAKDS